MATTPGSTQTGNQNGVPSVEDVTDRIRGLNEKIIEAGKNAGGSWLDAYEKSLTNMLEFEKKAANATQLDWVTALAKAHTDFVTNVTGAYTNAARDLLK